MTHKEHSQKAPSLRTGVFALLGGLLRANGSGASAVVLAIGALAVVLPAALPASASAYATLEGPPIYSSAPGLPDGRVYEQVSPADKNGNEAGAGTSTQGELVTAQNHYALAAPDGNSVLFETTGPMGETASAESLFFVAQHSSGGWKTHAVMPAAQQPPAEIQGTVGAYPKGLDPSADLSHVMFVSGEKGTFATDTPPECFAGGQEQKYLANQAQLYLSGSDPFLPATWLLHPEIPNPSVDCAGGTPVGGTPNFSTVYFTSSARLLPEGSGFYEDSEGTLRDAGVLPNESPSPFGAAPAAGSREGNEVSADGTRAFFVSPAPGAPEPPQLYVRENGSKSVLVSQDTLLPGTGALPASAPDGALAMPNPLATARGASGSDPFAGGSSLFASSYVFASPDGSQAFFQSTDDLTKAAGKESPGPEPKTYDFDVNTGELTYLPDVVGQIVASDTEGTSFAFVRPAAGTSPAELDLWSGPEAGHVTPIVQLPEAGNVSEARISSDGSVVVFVTNSRLSSSFNSNGFEQIYRYDAPTNTLGCVSCTPPGVTPTGDAVMSQLLARESEASASDFKDPGLVEPRGISADGDRVFFDTPDPLVPQDTNTGSISVHKEGAGKVSVQEGRDVYEWENGVVYLISSGKSTRNSFFLDNSENGGDVFFATAEGLVPGDTDGGYDVYDARVPQLGDNPPAAAVPCEGSVCQGPPNVPSPLTPPASATFSGLGNAAPEPAPAAAVTKKTTTKTVKCKKGFTKKKNKCVRKAKPKKAKKSNRGSK